MSESDRAPAPPKSTSGGISDGLAKGIIGFALGAGITFLAMHFFGPRQVVSEYIDAPINMAPPTVPSGPDGEGGGPPGGDLNKRKLAAIVGGLELLSRQNLDLHLQIEKEQAAQIAAELGELREAKWLTANEAQSRLEKLDSLLTPQQKEKLASVEQAAGEGDAAGGQNPFTQEANLKRLNDLLDRLKPDDAQPDASAE